MPTPARLNADTLASELTKLPSLTAPTDAQLDSIYIAVARAVASGQSADQLANDLGVPAGWQSVDVNKMPGGLVRAASAAKPRAALPGTAPAPAPTWIAKIVPVALAKSDTMRIAVLDREPTALGGLELPAWARSLSPAATYGPVSVTSPNLQVAVQKWIQVFHFTEIVEFVRSGSVLCVVPLSIFHFGSPTQTTILSGSAWIAAQPFAAAAPADGFAGIAIQSGELTSDQPLTFSGTTVTAPPGATLSLSLVPATSPGGPAGFPASITAPGKISVTFPASGQASISFDHCAATLYGENLNATPVNAPAAYNPQLQLLYIPGQSSASAFKPKQAAGKILQISGSAPIESAGWALSVSESTSPETLGTAANSGDFALIFGPGFSSKWTGLEKPEPSLGGALIAQNSTIVLYLFSGSAPGVLAQQVFELWNDQDAKGRRCQLIARRAAGQLLMFALFGTEEILELGAALQALVDRPLLATGARVPALFSEGLVALIRNNSGNRLFVSSTTPASNPPSLTGKVSVYPMALDNALLDVSEPLAILISAKADASFNATDGFLYLLFGYLLVELYLPDPYTGGLQPGRTEGPPSTFAAEQGNAAGLRGYLIAQVAWPAISTAKLRLSDTAHSHPVTPPATEAGSTAVPPQSIFHPQPIHLIDEAALATSAETQLAPQATAPQPGPPLPEPLAGALLLDLSTRASQLGVEVTTNERADEQYTIDGLSVRGPASLLPLATLPAIAWEPMYNLSTAIDPGVSDSELRHPPNDGPVCQVRPTSATLIPISPLQSLQALLYAGQGGFTAQITLPFGLIGTIDATAGKGTLLPVLSLVQPVFPGSATPSGAVYTGAWQLSFAAPDPNQPDPIFAGHSYLRTQEDNPIPGLSYGEQVLGASRNVVNIFNSRFNPPVPTPTATPGIPLRRYDLTGYGASTFSEWTNTTPYTTDVIKAFFHVLIGRTSHEVIQVQSIICPWAIKVVRTITIDRQASGAVQRYDSGWQAASDGLFQYPASTGITADQIQAGVIGGVINVKNIQQIGLPVNTQGTEDGTGFGGTLASTLSIPVQPVTFDADVIIQPQHVVLQGGSNLKDLTGQMHVCAPSSGVTGFIPLQTGYHLSVTDMADFGALSNGAGGPINATMNVGQASSLFRATSFDATPILDSAVTNGIGIIGAVRGIPKLSSDGSWSMGARAQSQAAPVSLPPTQPVPLVQPNKSGGTTPGSDVHFANPEDIFRLATGSPVSPQTFFGFLQATGTQSNFLSRPFLTVGSQNLTLADALNVAHAGALLGAISSFPGLSNTLQFLSSELGAIKNQLSAPSLQTTQSLQLSDAVRSTPFPLISTSIADVNLYFYWKGEYNPPTPPPPPNPATVVISLGQPTDPSWSLDINHVAIGLVIPALSSTPILWLEGGFHADADSIPPSFPNLQVVFDGPLQPLTSFFTLLQSLQSVLSPGGGAGAEFRRAHGLKAHDDGSTSPGLNVHFSDGKLSVTDNFTLPDIPLGPGTISNVSLEIGTTLNILGLSIDFLVGIGSPDAPVHWIVDPLSGTICIQAGIQSNQMDILIQGGIGLGLAIDLGIASGSASIVIAVQIQVQGSTITLLFLLTGQASVSVLGGLASASITLTAGLGLSFNLSNPLDANLIGTASVGIHISICWVVNISWSGSWTFQKEINLAALP